MMCHVQAQGLTAINSPKLMGTPSESGAEVFGVKYFGGKAYLSQSPEFYKQMAILSGLGRVYQCASIFRAEKSFSSQRRIYFLDPIS